jgi:hypothetical protein
VAVLDSLLQLLSDPQPSAATPASTGSLLSQQASRRPDILQMLQDALGAPPGRSIGGAALDRYWNLRDLPDVVKNSIISQRAYGEGERIPPQDAMAQAGRAAILGENKASPPDSDTSQLQQELDMVWRYLQQNQPRDEQRTDTQSTPWASILGQQSPYPAPLPPAAQRFPFGMY